jgi:dynein heavy chain
MHADACNDEYYGTIPEDDGTDSASDGSDVYTRAHASDVPKQPAPDRQARSHSFDSNAPKHSVAQPHASPPQASSPKRSISPTSLADPRHHLIKNRPADLVPRTIRMSLQHAQAPVYEPGDTDEAGVGPLATSADVLAYFVKHGAAARKQMFYLNRREKKELLDIVSPFDLVVVNREQRQHNHFVFTVMGVSEFWDDKESEFTPLGEWMRLSTACSLTVSMPFFKNFTCVAHHYRDSLALCGASTMLYCLRVHLVTFSRDAPLFLYCHCLSVHC